MRPEIAESWRRTTRCGLDPGARLDDLPIEDVDRSSRLLRAATPVLDRIAAELDDTRFSIMLADHTGRIVGQRFGRTCVRTGLETIGGVVGRRFDEESTGTNGVATVLETRRRVAVHGDEHFLDVMKGFSCHGHPLVDRTTGRLTGIIDITCPNEDRTRLMAPLLAQVADDIELRLVQSARLRDQRLLAAFRATRRRPDVAVVALGDDITLINTVGRRVLAAADLVTLGGLAEGPGPYAVRLVPVTLSSGRAATARVRPVGSLGAAVIEVEPAPGDAVSPGSAARSGPALISGEPGSGRTTRALAMIGPDPVRLDAIARIVTAEEITAALDGPADVLIESYDRLEPAVARVLADRLPRARARVVLTGGPLVSLGEDHLAVAARCPATIELPPLRHRLGELNELAATMLDDATVRLSPDALAILMGQPWPGNLTQLRTVLASAVRTGVDIITAAELPESVRSRPRRTLGLLEQGERATIQHVLDTCGHNYRAAARVLGISPTTLYRKARLYDLPGASAERPIVERLPPLGRA